MEATATWWREWCKPCRFSCDNEQMARRGQALADHAEAADLRADGRHRRGADDVAAGVARRPAQLGLPLLLDPRFDADAVCVPERRLSRRGLGVARMVAACRGRKARATADHVRHRRRALPAGARAAVVAGLRGQPARADRQRRDRAAPTRRVRRDHGRAARGARSRAGAVVRRLALQKALLDASRERVGDARPGHLGGPRSRSGSSRTRDSCAGSRSTAQ